MSQPDVVVFPSLLQRVIDYLKTHTHLTSFLVDRVAPNLNGYQENMRWVMVSPAPGTRPVSRRLDARTLTINCYAEDYDSTRELAERALAAVLSMRGTYVDLVVSRVEVSITPFDLTDQLSGRYRFVADVLVYFRPL